MCLQNFGREPFVREINLKVITVSYNVTQWH